MATLVITHTHADGTILSGSSRGDGVYDIARRHGFTYRPEPGIHIRGSRDRDARRRNIEACAADLRTAGHTVDIDINNTPRTAAERRTALDERADDRVERLTERAGKATAESDRRTAARHAITDGIPFGQPVQPPGHHSRNRHLRALDRADTHRQKGVEAAEKAEHLTSRAAGAVAHAAHRNDPPAMMRRIETLQTQRRGYARELEGYTREHRNGAGEIIYRDEFPPATGGRAEDLRRWDARDAEEVTYLREQLAALAGAGTFVAWTPEHFVKGDALKVSGHGWYVVTRVNKKSASLDTDGAWPRTITWDKVAGRRRDGLQWDTPHGEPWPVELAQRVARWARLTRSASRQRDYPVGSPQWWEASHVATAVRLVHGLLNDAPAAQVDAIRASITGTDATRALASAYLAVWERLTAGELVPDIAATLTPITGAPAWSLPVGVEPETRRAGPGWPHTNRPLVQVGDLVAGIYDRGGTDGRHLHTHFCGPVSAVSPVNDRRERGEFVTITLAGGACETLDVTRWLAVHPAGTWEHPAAVDHAADHADGHTDRACAVAVNGEAAPPGLVVTSTGRCPACGAVAAVAGVLACAFCADCQATVPLQPVERLGAGPYPHPPVTVTTPDGPVTYRPGDGTAPATAVRIIRGPLPPAPTVRTCDVGGEDLPRDHMWWLVAIHDPTNPDDRHAACAAHTGVDAITYLPPIHADPGSGIADTADGEPIAAR
ncbi:DUF3560 domain-containing protein [Dactylosporangium sp. NPDC051485]|uniref:DUF3560 domain-containing protein n=1 Tax=Dactylosporangium sp. NPDC051485 TaxID=3154846 RepID=UPI00343F3E39